MGAKVLRWTALTVATALAVGTVAACTHSSDSGNAASGGAAAGGGFAAESVRPDAAPPATGGAGKRQAAAGSVGGTAVLAGDPLLDSAKIRTAEIAVVVKRSGSVAAQANAAEAIALRAGGEVDADERVSGPDPVATVVLRVPPDQLAAVLNDLAALGKERSRHLSTEDVTSKVADVTSRVTSARQAIARLRALYQRAVKIADVIEIEDELSGRESDLESLEAQQRSLAAQTATAAVTLTLTRRAAPSVPPARHHHSRTGFIGGLANGWHAFAGAATAVLVAVGAALPFVALLLVLAFGLRALWPRLRPARRTVPAAPPAD
jgi:hypothetical protein